MMEQEVRQYVQGRTFTRLVAQHVTPEGEWKTQTPVALYVATNGNSDCSAKWKEDGTIEVRVNPEPEPDRLQRARDFVAGWMVGRMRGLPPQDVLPAFLGHSVAPGIDPKTVRKEDPRIMPWVDAFELALSEQMRELHDD